jgi:hypothetical protein
MPWFCRLNQGKISNSLCENGFGLQAKEQAVKT